MLIKLIENKYKVAGLSLPLAARLYSDGTEAAVDRLMLLVLALFIAYALGAKFAREADRPIGPGIIPFVLMFVVFLPAPVSLVSAGVAICFGSIFGREVFGGKPILPPALIALAFALFSYPDDGFQLRHLFDQTQDPVFAAASLAGGTIYLWKGFLAWRVVAGAALGSVLGSQLTMGSISWEQPLLGTYVAGVLFLAAGVESAPRSENARWLHGFTVGMLIMVIRSADPDQPDGVVFAALLGCLFAPLLDKLVKWRPRHE
ncbi:MAG: RnfABCDGE type electron transport complex subunit D [Rhodospirillaceae bacterium]|nr:RnfABCDGE type electron transport complex subunit D [Rhodospirillaceae bacterium]